MNIIAVAPAMQSGNHEAIKPFLANVAKANPIYDAVGYILPNGMFIKLAEQSQEAAGKIADLIGEIQGETDKAVVAMTDGTREAKAGAEVVNAVGAAFREIAGLVAQVSGQVKEISAAMQQMASGSQQIVSSVKQIDELGKKAAGDTQSVSAAAEEQLASTEEIASSSQALAKLAQDLQNAVAEFRM